MALPTLAGDRVRYVPTELCVPGAGSCLGLQEFRLDPCGKYRKSMQRHVLEQHCPKIANLPMCFGSLGEKSSCHLQDDFLGGNLQSQSFVACSSRPMGI